MNYKIFSRLNLSICHKNKKKKKLFVKKYESNRFNSKISVKQLNVVLFVNYIDSESIGNMNGIVLHIFQIISL